MGGGRAWPGFEIDDSEPRVHAWREPRGPRGPRSRAEVPVGGGRAWPGFEIDDSEPKARVRRSRGRPDPTAPGTPVGPQATSETGRAAAHRHTQPHNNQHPQQPALTTKRGRDRFPATASSRSISATQQSGTASDQAVMSTWSSTAARPASRRATGTRNGEQDT